MFRSMPYDQLHTLNLGLVKNVYVWTMATVKYIGSTVDQAGYSDNMAILDNRVIDFVLRYPLAPVSLFKFSKGFSHMFTAAKSTRGALAEHNMSAGKVEGQKFPCLIFMLSLIIGCDGRILPNSKEWSAQHLPPTYHYMNVTEIVLKALSSMCEVCFALKCRDPTETYLVHLQEVCYFKHILMLKWSMCTYHFS